MNAFNIDNNQDTSQERFEAARIMLEPDFNQSFVSPSKSPMFRSAVKVTDYMTIQNEPFERSSAVIYHGRNSADIFRPRMREAELLLVRKEQVVRSSTSMYKDRPNLSKLQCTVSHQSKKIKNVKVISPT